jgi:HSP20 family protein
MSVLFSMSSAWWANGRDAAGRPHHAIAQSRALHAANVRFSEDANDTTADPGELERDPGVVDPRRTTRVRDATRRPLRQAGRMALPVRTERADPATWDPLAEFRNIVSQLGRFPDPWRELIPQAPNGFTPLADVEETDDAYLIEVELPGVDKKDIDVSVAGRRLTISGERKEKERVGILRRRTRSVGRFEYDIQLPGDVDEGGVNASLGDGVLTVRVPKATTDRARRITVK